MKKIILGSVAILFIIVILIILISNALRTKPQQSNSSLFPTVSPHTSTPINKKTGLTSQSSSQKSSNASIGNQQTQSFSRTTEQSSSPQQEAENLYTPSNPNLLSLKDKENMTYLNNFIPFDNTDFSIEHSPILNKYIVTTKGEGGNAAFTTWAKENGVLETLQNKNNAIISSQTISEINTLLPPELRPTKDPQEASHNAQKQIGLLLNLFNVFFSVPESINTAIDYNLVTPTPTILIPTQYPSETQMPTLPPFSTPTPSTTTQTGGGYVYYPQCGGPYDNYPLTPSITVCKCGCGPTTVSMILSSYLGRSITPPQVVDIYKSQGRAQCGTSLGSAKKIINEQGVATSDYIVPYNENGYNIEQVAGDMRSYIHNGWTIFVLASFSSSSALNHFFWITNIDDQNNVYAYDPYYGSGKIPPINQNVRYPYPKYLAAFGVRK